MEPGSRPSSAGSQHRDGKYEALDEICTSSIFRALSPFFRSGKFSDMTITCGDRVFKAHKVVVCSQSSFFDKALSGPFKESITATIDLPEDDSDTLERFLEFLYTGNYDDKTTPTFQTPADTALMTPGEVNNELSIAPGVTVTNCRNTGPPDSLLASRRRGRTGGGDGGGNIGEESDDASDPTYVSPNHGSEENKERSVGNDSEPEEEYNEYLDGGGSIRGTDSEAPENADEPDAPEKTHELDAAQADREDLIWELSEERKDLSLHLQVYIMADKFGVPALKLLARDRFYRAAEFTWEVADEFPAVVDELYTNTPETEVAMREIVCRLVGSRLLDHQVRERMYPIMRKHGDFAVDVMNYHLFSTGCSAWDASW